MSFQKAKISSLKLDGKEKYQTQSDKVWLLNLDQIEQHTGQILSKEYVNISEIGNSTHYFSKGTVLYSKLRPYLNKVVIADEEGFSTTELVPINCDLNKIDPQYLAYFLRSDIFLNFATNVVAGAKMPRMVMSEFWDYEIPLPSLSEQRRIASILDKTDELRQKRQQVLEKLDQFLKSTFYDFFGDPIQNPKGFTQKRFEEIIKFTGGSQPPKSVFSDVFKEGYIRLVQIRDFRTDKYITYIPEKQARRRFTKSDVMIGRYGPPVFQILRGLEGSYNVALMKAEPKADLDNEFLFHLLSVDSIQQLVISNSQRSAGQTGVNLEFLNKLVVGVPPLELQKKWAVIAIKIEDQKQKLYKQLEIQNNLLKSLQNQAFSGKL